MSWIKWTRGLARKPEVLAMSSALKLDRHHVAGLLMAVWEWVDENVTLESRDERDTEHATLRIGPHAVQLLDSLVGVQGFADAMSSAGWLHIRSDHVAFPNFFRHNGQSAKDRALAANRQSRKRHAGVTLPSRSHRDQRREEERRDKDPPNPPAGGKRAKKKSGEEHPHFAAFWAAYPRKTARAKAAESFARIAPDEATFAAMLAALDRQRRSADWCKDGGRFIPYPATWLNQRRWEDQPPEVSKPAAPDRVYDEV